MFVDVKLKPAPSRVHCHIYATRIGWGSSCSRGCLSQPLVKGKIAKYQGVLVTLVLVTLGLSILAKNYVLKCGARCASRTSPGFPAPRAGYNNSVEIGGETMGTITTKRIYDEPGDADGERILVDRLWPRGISKDRARLTAWDKDVAPSTELRKWFGHDPDRFAEFSARYRDELSSSSAAEELASRCRDQLVQGRNVTLLYAAKDTSCNHAVVLGDWLAEKTKTA